VLLIGVFVYRTLTLQAIYRAMRDCVIVLGAVMLVMATAGLAQFILALMQAGNKLAVSLIGFSAEPVVFLALVGCLLVPLCMVLEARSVLILMPPLLLPAAAQYRFDPVQFGVFLVLALTIGLLTPPVGLSMFVSCATGKLRVEQYTREVLPFLAFLIALLIAIATVPKLSLWLPELVG